LPRRSRGATERFTVYYGLFNGNTTRGELQFVQEIAETFLREAEREARTTEFGFGRHSGTHGPLAR
jgi:hypothetical protein